MKRLVLTAWLSLFLFCGIAFAEDDFQYWSWYTAKIADTEKIDFSIYADARFFNDTEDLGLYLFSPQVTYDFWKNLTLKTSYTNIQVKSNNPAASRSEWKFQHRVEIEANPHFQITDWLKFGMRNRMEFRWIEDNGSHNPRSRHRVGFTIPIKESSSLKAFYMNSEFFYDYAKHEFSENRSVPAGLSFRLDDKTDLAVFYMIQQKKGSDDWSSNQILGTHLVFSF